MMAAACTKSSSHDVASREIDTHPYDPSLDILFSAVPVRDPDGRGNEIAFKVYRSSLIVHGDGRLTSFR
jgi:hypothetical protein